LEKEIFDNNLEPKVMPVLCENRQDQGWPRLTRTNQSANNSHDSRGSR
ncbi:32991_t:CDS:1, partial [Gigaspora margarita]